VGQSLLYAVHLLTASGAALAVLAAIAVAGLDWRTAFIWLGLALIVDGIDGPIARRLRVRERLPDWDGGTLDFVIDYTTYVFVPAIILALGCGLSGFAAALAATMVAVSGAIYFADTRMKQDDNSFRGFPAGWNMIVFVLFVLAPHPAVVMAVTVALAALTFLPVRFIHPVRVERWRPLTLTVAALWFIVATWIVAANFDVSPVLQGVLLAASLYMFGVGAVQQIFQSR
jgi:phosphatidylcholine synthase